ncbi:MAG TPA: S9 family peptidase [Acidimicrobiales bacterium]|nr:S9 family peptidase [Acidimicrobiales bacterium]
MPPPDLPAPPLAPSAGSPPGGTAGSPALRTAGSPAALVSPLPPPPLAPRRPGAHTAHGDVRPDDWHWLSDRDDPEVTGYLRAENSYAEQVLAPTAGLQEELFQEIRARVAETDISAPVFHEGWWYWSRTVAGLQYPVHCRRADPNRSMSAAQVLAAARAALPGAGVAGDGTPPPTPPRTQVDPAAPSPGRVFLDENVLAGTSDYFALGVFDIRPDQEVLAYATDLDGSERYTLRFRDLGSGDDLVDIVEDVHYGSAWSTDCKSFYYTRPDKAMRPWQVWRHTLGTPAAKDHLVYQEDDERFFVSVDLTRSKCFVVITSQSKMSSEVRYLRADKERAHLSLVLARREGVEYDVDHTRRDERDLWLVRTNRGPAGEELENFAVFQLPVGETDPRALRQLVPYRPEVKVEGVEAFARFALLSERSEGIEQLRVVDLGDASEHLVPQPEPVYTLHSEGSPEWATELVRFGYSSLVTPPSSIDYNMATRERSVVKEATVGGGFRASDYRSERLWAEAPDGTKVPISLVCPKSYAMDGSAPCLLYGYGSYEITIGAGFSATRLNLLERGFVFAIAHVRGGGEMGRPWYEQGRLSHKRNTFTDFVACAELLVSQGWTSPDRLVIRGGSAGGLLMGAVTNMRPELWRAVVAEVPFVDVVTTMSDESLPLTVTEWEEWGNPRDDPDAYDYMKSYSPYDNVHAAEYPAIYATAGLNDPRVGYWEPAKWVAKLRATQTGGNPVLLRTEMGAGHQGPSGRYDAWRDEARVQAFVLASVGIES